MNTYLNLFRNMQIDKAGLQQTLGEDLHNIVCEKSCVIKREDVSMPTEELTKMIAALEANSEYE